ncbi:hypothetical protein ACFOWA_14260 [Pedobacter lithocola]|uniref:Uncharacterized protein n=1 Tax=Pedobacter lithocola TaxID=1908239 RepID=A0ABV8PBJ7_9SPHI
MNALIIDNYLIASATFAMAKQSPKLRFADRLILPFNLSYTLTDDF